MTHHVTKMTKRVFFESVRDIAPPKMRILSITHIHAFPNMYDFFHGRQKLFYTMLVIDRPVTIHFHCMENNQNCSTFF